MKHPLSLLVTGVLFLGFTACTKRTPPRMAGACANEVQQFCPMVEPGNGRIIKCLDEHLAELSSSCRTFQDERRDTVVATEKPATGKEVSSPAPSAANPDTPSGICTGKEPCVDPAKQAVKTAKSESPRKTSAPAKKK